MPDVILKDHLHHLTNMKARGQKYQFSNFLMNWGNLEVQSKLFKNANFPSFLGIRKNMKVYTTQDQHFEIQILKLWMSWEKLCPNLSFTGKNKMENLSKKVWPHFKLNIND